MLALIDKGPERFAHPAAWAPFVVAGKAGSDWRAAALGYFPAASSRHHEVSPVGQMRQLDCALR